MAINTARCTELTGVITRSLRGFKFILPLGQERTQTPQPRQISSAIFAFLFSKDITPMGQARTHLPQPIQLFSST